MSGSRNGVRARCWANPRSTQRYRPKRSDADRQLIAEMRRLVEAYPRYGSERVHRLWKGECLQVPAKQRKRRRRPWRTWCRDRESGIECQFDLLHMGRKSCNERRPTFCPPPGERKGPPLRREGAQPRPEAGKSHVYRQPPDSQLKGLVTPSCRLALSWSPGTYKKNARNYDIVVKLEEMEGKDQIEGFEFPGPPGHPVLLGSLANISEGLASIQITRRDKRRVTKFLAMLGDIPLGTAVAEISRVVDTQMNMPAGYDYQFAGVYEIMEEGLVGFAEAGVIAVVLVVLTLAAILESFKQPALILITVPLALIGVFWALVITGASLGIFVIMGVIMMVGIVVNNAILIMDQFNVHVREGVPRHQAMIMAACERFRPIVMITVAAVLGMLPLAMGRGLGAEMRNGVGIASVGGILVSGALTLIVMPILYDLFTRKKEKTDA